MSPLQSSSQKIPPVFSQCLQKLESDAEFAWSSPRLSSSTGNHYFAKIGSSYERDQFVGEAESLRALNAAAPGTVPRLIASGLVGPDGEEVVNGEGNPYFISEYKDLGPLSNHSATVLGRRLATEIHAYKGTDGFGFAVPTFCGATRMENGWYNSWEECYDALIEGLLFQLKKQGRFSILCSKGEQVRKRSV
jgi:protein-ribulosamine 3-kinase